MSLQPDIAWSTLVSNVEVSSPYHFYINTNPLDPGEFGSGELYAGDYLIAFDGYPYEITYVDGSRIEVYDVLERGDGTLSAYAPYEGKIGYIYRPKNGAILLSMAQMRKLDRSAQDIIHPIEKGIIWAHRGVSIEGLQGNDDDDDDDDDMVDATNITKLVFEDKFRLESIGSGWQGGEACLITLDGLLHNELPDIEGSGNIHLDQDQVDALWMKAGNNIYRENFVGINIKPEYDFDVYGQVRIGDGHYVGIGYDFAGSSYDKGLYDLNNSIVIAGYDVDKSYYHYGQASNVTDSGLYIKSGKVGVKTDNPQDDFHVGVGHARFKSLETTNGSVVTASDAGRIRPLEYSLDVDQYLCADGTWKTISLDVGSFLDAVTGIQVDNTLQPDNIYEERYILLNASSLHVDFGTITGVGNNDIVEYDGSDWNVVFDASAATTPATVTAGYKQGDSTRDNHQWTYNVTDDVWIDRGGVITHNSLLGLQGGIGADRYHFLEQEHTDLLTTIGGGDIADTYHTHSQYVTLSTSQTISGEKTFTNKVIVGSDLATASLLAVNYSKSEASADWIGTYIRASSSTPVSAHSVTALKVSSYITGTGYGTLTEIGLHVTGRNEGGTSIAAILEGKVAINKTTASYMLDVNGDGSISGALIVGNASAATHAVNRQTGDGRYGQLATTNSWLDTQSITKTSSGNLTQGLYIKNNQIGDNTGASIDFGFSTATGYYHAAVRAYRTNSGAVHASKIELLARPAGEGTGSSYLVPLITAGYNNITPYITLAASTAVSGNMGATAYYQGETRKDTLWDAAYTHSQIVLGNPHGITLTSLGGVPETRSIIADKGLTGGGFLNADVILTLGTPGTLTFETTDSLSNDSHTHSIITQLPSSSTGGIMLHSGTKTEGGFYGEAANPSGTSRTNYDGYLYATRFYGVGTYLTALNAGNITTGTLSAARGGTGISLYAEGDLLMATGSTTLSRLVRGVSGQLLWINPVTNNPAWMTPSYLTANQTIVLSGDITGSGSTGITTTYNGIVPVTKGGTGVSSFTARRLVLTHATSGTGNLRTVSGAGTAGQILTSNGSSADPTWQDPSGGIDPYAALTSGSSVIWDCSGGLNKTLSRGGNFTLYVTNLSNGMSGDLRLNITSITSVTLSTGKVNKGNGRLTLLVTGVYHLCFTYDGTNFDWNIAKYE